MSEIDRRINEKETWDEKLETARALLRDAKQGKLEPLQTWGRDPGSSSYYRDPNRGPSATVVDYCQAWVEYLEHSGPRSESLGKNRATGGPRGSKEQLAPAKQDFWDLGVEDFKSILRQLSVRGAKFVSDSSYKVADQIFEGHFKHPELLTSGPRIDWIGTWKAFKCFHRLLLEKDRIEQKSYSHFFAAHFKYKGTIRTDLNDITNSCRGDCSPEDSKKLEKILL